MYCNNCGSPVEPNDVYCGNCGSRIEHKRVGDTQPDIAVDSDIQEFFGESGDNNQNTSSATSGSSYSNGENRTQIKFRMQNNSALISLVCGIASLLMAGTVILSIILAVVANNSGKKARVMFETGEYDGEIYYKAGMLCGKIGLVVSILLAVFYVIYFIAAAALIVMAS